MKLSIAFGVCAAASNALAQQPAAPVKTDWVRAVVIVDGGSIYQDPDFDSKVIEYVNSKTPLWASRKPLPGRGGMGLFHRVHVQGKTGYMADTDIRISDKESPPAGDAAAGSKKSPAKKVRSKAYATEEEENFRKSEPLYFQRYVGGALSLINFTEKFENQTKRSNMLMYGLRMTGPGVLFDGPPLDFNFLFSLSKPGYYSGFTKSVSGFLLFGDTTLVLPFIERTDWLWTYGLGVMWTYTNYKVRIGEGSKFDSQEVRLGLDFALGAAYRFGPPRRKIYAIRADAKYYFEKTRYYGFTTSFQTEY